MTSVTSELSLMRPDGTEFTEAQMAAADPGTFPDFVGMDGRVTLVHGGDRFDVGDTLLYAVTELCGTIVPQLAADGEAVYGAIAHEEELTFTLSGETIEIASAYRRGVTLPAEDTLSALVDSGRRLVSMLPQLWPAATPEEIENVRIAVEAGAERAERD